MKKRRIQGESYAPVSTWPKAPDFCNSFKINDGEFRIVSDPRTGVGAYVVAQMKGVRRYCAYVDGNRVVKGFVDVSLK